MKYIQTAFILLLTTSKTILILNIIQIAMEILKEYRWLYTIFLYLDIYVFTQDISY